MFLSADIFIKQFIEQLTMDLLHLPTIWWSILFVFISFRDINLNGQTTVVDVIATCIAGTSKGIYGLGRMY